VSTLIISVKIFSRPWRNHHKIICQTFRTVYFRRNNTSDSSRTMSPLRIASLSIQTVSAEPCHGHFTSPPMGTRCINQPCSPLWFPVLDPCQRSMRLQPLDARLFTEWIASSRWLSYASSTHVPFPSYVRGYPYLTFSRNSAFLRRNITRVVTASIHHFHVNHAFLRGVALSSLDSESSSLAIRLQFLHLSTYFYHNPL